MPSEEWIEIPVPPIVDAAVFEAVRAQLEENRRRKRERQRGPCWLLQGLTVCRRCGYAYYGKTAPRSRPYDTTNTLRYYRCTGADGYRFSGKAVCNNGPVRGDQLEKVVWDQVRALLEEPHRVADEYRRRIAQARDGVAMPDEIIRLDRQMTSLRRGIDRLIDSYTEGVIDKAEFEPRIAGLKQRVSQLQERHQAALDAAETERDLALVVSRLEDFSAKVATGLDHLDRLGMQDIIRTVVRRIEIDDSRIEIIFRVPSPDGPAGPRSPTKTNGSWQHCTGVGRTDLRLDDAVAAARARLRAAHRRLQGHDPRRPRKPPAQTDRSLKCILKRTLTPFSDLSFGYFGEAADAWSETAYLGGARRRPGRRRFGVLKARRVKSDKADALALAEMLRTGFYSAVHVKSEASHRLKALLGDEAGARQPGARAVTAVRD